MRWKILKTQYIPQRGKNTFKLNLKEAFFIQQANCNASKKTDNYLEASTQEQNYVDKLKKRKKKLIYKRLGN